MNNIDRYLEVGTLLQCEIPHGDGNFTMGKTYRVNAHRYRSVPGGVEYVGVRIRDDKRQRKDFNFIPTSKNYIWKYFKMVD